MRRIGEGSAAGILAAGLGVAAAELFAAATRPRSGPLVAVGGAVIDAAPTAVKEFAVRTFGVYDKPVLLGGIVLVLTMLAALIGVLGQRRRGAVPAGAALFGLAGAGAALSRPAAMAGDVAPSLLGALIAGVSLWWLLHLLRPRPTPVAPTATGSTPAGVGSVPADGGSVPAGGGSVPAGGGSVPAGVGSVPAGGGSVPAGVGSVPADGGSAPAGRRETLPADFDRRRFLAAAALVAGSAVAAGGGARWVRAARGASAGEQRAAVRLPAAADPARPRPAGVAPGFVTANRDFYRVDTALTVPSVDLDSWRLRVHGRVTTELELTFAELLDRPLIERDITLNCVSNEVGGPYVGTARWLGVPLAPLLREAGIDPGADQLVARSVDGMTIGTPIEVLLDGRDAMLAVGMNGEPLPAVNGFPVRMLTPGLYGYAGACKWLSELELTSFADFDAYWVRRGWAAHGPVKTASRIDSPKPFSRLPAGPMTIAGVAWAQGRGISRVEVSVDDGPWQRAELLPAPSTDTWVQWRHRWDAAAGPHSLAVRATDGAGAVQPVERARPFPDGATGWHTVSVTVG